eukprot:CAMPEP_0113481982 /NCGR_PEP_ID=MMETSP0014_2-20120614/22686_1 /TAXON_ID=2857 /ORGANISM="Nitzschia sp." /LENGTH=207 /DNA_ID=CAMNT_0000375489 /DNA_START=155 /DNA_END=778 /DNA_ORIENTATION=+ /assembly_acc=CAM_ASM_000159
MSFIRSLFVVSAVYLSGPACAFSPSSTVVKTPTSTSTSTTTSLAAVESSGSSSRRDMLQNIVSFGMASATSVVALGGFPTEAAADARPMYLTEPTDEFKASEAKAMEFKRQQLAVKKEFSVALDKFLAEPNDEDAIVADLKTLKALIAKNGGLPLGIKKDELYKIIRSKKAKGFWPTNCEIAYQSLKGEVSFQQNPNLEKDMGNPYQ